MSKWTKEMPHTSLEFTNIDLEARVETDGRPIYHTIDHPLEIDIEAGEVTITTVDPIIGPTIGTGPETNIGVIKEEIITGLVISKIIIGKVVKETISTKTITPDQFIEVMIHNRDLGIEVKVETGPGIMIVIITEVEIDMGIDKPDQELELCQMTEGHPCCNQIQE